MLKRFLLLIFVASLLIVARPVAAQTPMPSGPVYIVQPGDTLSAIADRFNLTVTALLAANNIANPNLLDAGQQLVIPGLQGVTGTLGTEIVNFGDSFRSLVRKTQVSVLLLRKLNRLVSPSELYVGANIIIPQQNNIKDLTNRIAPAAGESLLELAVSQNTDAWTVASLNNLNGTWDTLPGDVLYSKGTASNQTASGLPSAFISAQIASLPLKQGGTGEFIVQPEAGATINGALGPYALHFFPLGDGRMVALQGIHALLEPGVYPLRLDAILADGSKQSFEQMALIASGNYPKESLSVSSELIDPAVTGPEDKQVEGITAPLTPAKQWQAPFNRPVYLPAGFSSDACIYDHFGTRRSFNGSGYIFFHSGLDFGVCFAEHPLDIYAAAPGKVVFAGPLTVRGNATFIDHGWGVYTAYYHQSQVNVSVGQQVQAGQIIGQIGKTGRVTGPHLHWEVWVNGIQVDPFDWLRGTYP